jgi:hypothetical protein
MRIPKTACLIFVCHFLVLSSALAQQTFVAPVPTEILAAKKIFISNGGTDSFSPAERYTSEAYRAYNQLYGALQKSARFQLVSTPAEADLVIEVSTQVAVKAQDRVRLTIYETKSHYILWRLDSWVRLSLRRATSDQNFDAAVTKLASDFEKLASPPQP